MTAPHRNKRLFLLGLPLLALGLAADAAPVCTYNNATASFGTATYYNNQATAATPLACTAGAPTTAARMNDTSYARSVLTAPNIGDFKFLQKNNTATRTPPAFEMVSGTGQETQAFPDILTAPAGGGCNDAGVTTGVYAIERHLHRSWPLFGQTYYYGDYNANPPNDPATVTTAASPYGKWQPYDPASEYIYQEAPGRWGPPKGTSGTGSAYPVQVPGYLPAKGCEAAAAGLTAAEQSACNSCLSTKGYYLHDGLVAGDLAKSVFKGSIVNDYPPAWVHFSWAFGYILNFQLHDASNNPLLPMARDTAQSSNGGSSCTTSNIQHTGGNFEPVGSATCGAVYPTYDWKTVQALGLGPVYNDQSNVEGSNSAWGSDGLAASPAGDLLAAGNWVDAFTNGTIAGSCAFCQQKSVLYIGFGQPCGESRPASLPPQTMGPCTGDCAYTNPACTCASVGNYLAEAAHYLYTSKNVRTYFIGMGQHTGAMRRAAAEGNGKYLDGRDAKQFHDSLLSILQEVVSSATSSATSTVNAVQVNVAGQQELVPRFVADSTRGVWEGHLFKYYLFSEFAANCAKAGDVVPVPNAQQPVCNATCVCPGGSCGGRWLVDAQCKLLAPDSSGFFYQATWNGTALVLPAQTKCLSNADCLPGVACNTKTGFCPPNVPAAVPVWDTNSLLQSVPWYTRPVYTAIDTNGDGAINALDGDGSSPGMYKITTGAVAGNQDLSGGVSDAVADALAPYMALEGTTTCGDIETLLGLALPAATPRLRACARVILNYALGEDLFNEQDLAYTDPAFTTGNRLRMLGDVFHSSPQDIGPPPSLSDCGLDTRRCVSTLFNMSKVKNNTEYQALDFPSQVFDPATMTTISNPGTVDAYSAYYQNETFGLKRPHVSLFGANDGLVHAVQTACFVNTSKVGATITPNYWDGAGTGSCIAGSKSNGSELWAFIPPDLLPKLAQLILGKHQYFVDNSPMVRDIYSPAGTQSPLKRYTIGASPVMDFKRVAILGEREGGTHWLGLDVTDPTLPQFRWIFPQPNTEEELAVGQSWGDWVPNAPPIVPVRLAAPTGLGVFPQYAAASSGKVPVPFQEKWVVLLPGGYDAYGVVGKHVYMLDAYTGAKIFQTNDFGAVKQDFSFAALPAAVAWGSASIMPPNTYNNGFFDTAIYGDMGGQAWVMRFNDVGTGYPAGQVNNWFFGRSFRQAATDDTGVSPYKMQHRTPFFSMVSATRLDSGLLRAYLGSGDRANAAESGVGQCSIYNPLACGKQQCTMTIGENLYLNNNPSVSGVSSFAGDLAATYSTTWSETYAAGGASCSPAYQDLNACVSCAGGGAGATAASTSEPQYACTNTSTGWVCGVVPISESGGDRLEVATATPTPDPNTQLGYFSRFLAFNIFDSGTRVPFDSATSGKTPASAYDSAALTEAGSALDPTKPVPAGTIPNLFGNAPGNLPSRVGNTTVPVTVSGTGPGFYFYYPVLDERTATNSVLAQNCVSWYSMEPGQPCNADADCTAGACNTATHTCIAPIACGSSATAIPARSAFLYQVNATDGSSDCGLTSSTYLRTAAPLNAFLVPPPPPQQLISKNAKGQLQYSLIAPAGQLSPPAGSGIGGSTQPFSVYYTVGLPRDLEVCRHQYSVNTCNP